jgi:hypothetical protein
MNANLDLKGLKKIKPALAIYSKRFGKHVIFAAIIAVLFVYILIMLRISHLASADPAPDQQTVVTNSIPKVDKKAVDQILLLEQSNTEVHSLFESARTNPFQE